MMCFKSKVEPRVGVADLTTFSLLPFQREVEEINR